MKLNIFRINVLLLAFIGVFSFSHITSTAQAEVDPADLECLLDEGCFGLNQMELPSVQDASNVHYASSSGEYAFFPLAEEFTMNIYKRENTDWVLTQEIYPISLTDYAFGIAQPAIVHENLAVISKAGGVFSPNVTHQVYRLIENEWVHEHSFPEFGWGRYSGEVFSGEDDSPDIFVFDPTHFLGFFILTGMNGVWDDNHVSFPSHDFLMDGYAHDKEIDFAVKDKTVAFAYRFRSLSSPSKMNVIKVFTYEDGNWNNTSNYESPSRIDQIGFSGDQLIVEAGDPSLEHDTDNMVLYALSLENNEWTITETLTTSNYKKDRLGNNYLFVSDTMIVYAPVQQDVNDQIEIFQRNSTDLWEKRYVLIDVLALNVLGGPERHIDLYENTLTLTTTTNQDRYGKVVFLEPKRPADLISHKDGDMLEEESVTFEWDGGVGVDEANFTIYIKQGDVCYYCGAVGVDQRSQAVNIKLDGTPVTVELFSSVDGEFVKNMYMFETKVQQSLQLLSHQNGDILWSTEEFVWNAIDGASQYFLDIVMRGKRIRETRMAEPNMDTYSVLISEIPQNGQIVYVRLCARGDFNGKSAVCHPTYQMTAAVVNDIQLTLDDNSYRVTRTGMWKPGLAWVVKRNGRVVLKRRVSSTETTYRYYRNYLLSRENRADYEIYIADRYGRGEILSNVVQYSITR